MSNLIVAEKNRLRLRVKELEGLVKSAYHEGIREGLRPTTGGWHRAWDKSNANKALSRKDGDHDV